MTTPIDFNTQWQQLCEALELTPSGTWDFMMDRGGRYEIRSLEVVGLIATTLEYWEYPENVAANIAQWIALAHNLMPAIKEEMERLRSALEAEDKDHQLTVDTFRQQERIWDQKYEEQASELTEARARIETLQGDMRHLLVCADSTDCEACEEAKCRLT